MDVIVDVKKEVKEEIFWEESHSSNQFPADTSSDSKPDSLLSLLNSSFRGQLVLAYYKCKKEVLNNELSAIIIENEFENDADLTYKIKPHRFLQLRKEIKEIFPTELIETWYTPLARGINGEKINPRGRLYNAYNEKRRILNEINFFRKEPKRKKKDTVQEITFEEDESIALDFLKNNIEPEDLILNAWTATTAARSIYKNCNIDHYFNTFKCLQGINGIKLLLKDFDSIYGVSSGKFLLNWPTVAKKIIDTSKKRAKQNAELKKILEENKTLIEEGKIELIALILLPYLLGSIYRKRKRDSSWTPTKQDILDSFLLHIQTYEELTAYQEKKREIYLKEKLTFQPYPVLCGSLDQIHSSFVIINDIEYSVDSPLKAVDACFKSFFALNANYPVESSSCWTFLQKFVFNIAVEREDSAVNKLITQLQ